jgi:hypothetical protein
MYKPILCLEAIIFFDNLPKFSEHFVAKTETIFSKTTKTQTLAQHYRTHGNDEKQKTNTNISSVAEPEPQGAASFGRNWSRYAMRLRLRQWY